MARTVLPSWPCGFDSRHPLRLFLQVSGLSGPFARSLETPACHTRATSSGTAARSSTSAVPTSGAGGGMASPPERYAAGTPDISLQGLARRRLPRPTGSSRPSSTPRSPTSCWSANPACSAAPPPSELRTATADFGRGRGIGKRDRATVAHARRPGRLVRAALARARRTDPPTRQPIARDDHCRRAARRVRRRRPPGSAEDRRRPPRRPYPAAPAA